MAILNALVLDNALKRWRAMAPMTSVALLDLLLLKTIARKRFSADSILSEQ
jgi:hypothetical protein